MSNTTSGFNVTGIPWERFPGIINNPEVKSYVYIQQMLYKENGLLSSVGTPFEEDIWVLDVSMSSTRVRQVGLIFTDLPSTLKDFFKLYIIKIIPKYKPESTLRLYYLVIRETLQFAYSKSFRDDYRLISNEDIEKAINSKSISHLVKRQKYRILHQFFIFIQEECGIEGLVDTKKLQVKIEYEKSQSQPGRHAHKIKNLPNEYYGIILKKALEVLRDESTPYSPRVTVGMLIIQSQTGIRPDSLMSLEVNSLKKKELKNGQIAYDLVYRNEKERKAGNPEVFDKVPCNDYALEAYRIVSELRETIPESKQTPALYVLPRYRASADGRYTLQSRYKNAIAHFLYTYLPEESSRRWAGLHYTQFDLLDNDGHGIKTHISFPDLRQFRVNYATIADEKGAHLEAVRMALGHRSEHMKGYYNRPEDTYESDLARKEAAVISILDENVELIGFRGEELKSRIKAFIEKDKANVDASPEAILKRLDGTIGIRTKKYGYCISDPLFPCNRDTMINEIMCALDLCPNTYYIYHDLDRTLFEFEQHLETIRINKAHELESEAWKELHTMQQFLRRVVEPQIMSLEKSIAREGAVTVMEKHPNLVDVISNLELIKKDIEKWKNKKGFN